VLLQQCRQLFAELLIPFVHHYPAIARFRHLL
jgi:hypothetical protein